MFAPAIQADTESYANNAALVCNYELIATAPEQPSEFYFTRSGHHSVVSMETGPRRDAKLLQLYEFAKLDPNWDGYGADPIDKTCLANVEKLLLALPTSVPSPEITPNANGTLTLDWETDGQALSVEVGDDRYTSFRESPEGLQTDEGHFSQPLPSFIAMALGNLFPQATPVFPSYAEPLLDAEGQFEHLTTGHFR